MEAVSVLLFFLAVVIFLGCGIAGSLKKHAACCTEDKPPAEVEAAAAQFIFLCRVHSISPEQALNIIEQEYDL